MALLDGNGPLAQFDKDLSTCCQAGDMLSSNILVNSIKPLGTTSRIWSWADL